MKKIVLIYFLVLFSFSVYSQIAQRDTVLVSSKRVFQDNIDYSNVSFSFNRNQYHDDLKFNEDVFFGLVEFQSKVDFNHGTYQSDFGIVESLLNYESNFSRSKFKKEVYILASYFKKQSLFSNSLFNERVDLARNSFADEVIFSGSEFEKTPKIVSSNFLKSVSFESVKFENGADFSFSSFFFKANFDNLEGKGKLNFNSVDLPFKLKFRNVDSIYVDFRESKLNPALDKYTFLFNSKTCLSCHNSIIRRSSTMIDTLVYEYSDSNEFKSDSIAINIFQKTKKCVISLWGTNLANVILPYDRFWADTTGYSYEEKLTLYEKLIKKCKEEGMNESAQGWQIELIRVKTLKDWPRFGAFLNWFQEIFWNYGFSRWLILIWLAGAFLFFCLINFSNWIYPNLLKVYFNPDIGKNLFAKHQREVDILIPLLKRDRFVRFKYIIHYTGVVFFGLKLNHDHMSFQRLRWVSLFYLEFIIGLVLIGFTVNFILK